MKKFIVLSALVAVASTAFVACSSDDDLAQAPAVPEENVVDTPQGTPFSVNPSSGATRAVRFNANAWDGTSAEGKPWVSQFKIYARQATAEPNVWMNDVIFGRSAYNKTDWAPIREGSTPISSKSWPTENKTVNTSFYAITDNDISATNALANVSEWMTTLGQFHYDMPIATKSDMQWIDKSKGSSDFIQVSTNYVDSTKINDLMVATDVKTEDDCTPKGVLALNFTHALAGLTVKVRFLSDLAAGENNTVKIHYIKICGIKTSGNYDYTLNKWVDLDDYVTYYKDFTTTVDIAAQEEATPTSDVTVKDLVCPGEWLVIPQATTPWNAKYLKSGDDPAAGSAYVAVRIEDGETGDECELWYPLNVTLNPGKNKVLTIDLGQFYDAYQADTKDTGHDYPDKAARHYYEPTTVIPS